MTETRDTKVKTLWRDNEETGEEREIHAVCQLIYEHVPGSCLDGWYISNISEVYYTDTGEDTKLTKDEEWLIYG